MYAGAGCKADDPDNTVNMNDSEEIEVCEQMFKIDKKSGGGGGGVTFMCACACTASSISFFTDKKLTQTSSYHLSIFILKFGCSWGHFFIGYSGNTCLVLLRMWVA